MEVGIAELDLSPSWWVQPAMIKDEDRGDEDWFDFWCSLMTAVLRHPEEKVTEFSLKTHQLQLLGGTAVSEC